MLKIEDDIKKDLIEMGYELA